MERGLYQRWVNTKQSFRGGDRLSAFYQLEVTCKSMSWWQLINTLDNCKTQIKTRHIHWSLELFITWLSIDLGERDSTNESVKWLSRDKVSRGYIQTHRLTVVRWVYVGVLCSSHSVYSLPLVLLRRAAGALSLFHNTPLGYGFSLFSLSLFSYTRPLCYNQ